MKKNYTLLIFLFAFVSYAQVNNTFTGQNSGISNTGNYNNGFGMNSLLQNTGSNNSAFGISVLTNSLGSFNSAFGNDALRSNSLGSLNCAFGTRSLESSLFGNSNVAIGHRSMGDPIDPGSNNTAIGYATLLSNKGNNNVAIGYYTPSNLLTGDANIFIGASTGLYLKNGSNNVFLGKIAVNNAPSTSILTGDDTNGTVILADGIGNQKLFISQRGNVGIGLGNNIIPRNRLDINGGVVIGNSYLPKSYPFQIQGALAPANGLLVEGNVGVGTINPNNKLEITQGQLGNSGLRFTNLTSSFTPNQSNSTDNKFLSVNSSGDVILQYLPNATLSNLLSSEANTMTSNVNGISSQTPIVNSIGNVFNSSNQLITTVNGVQSAPVTIPIPNFTEVDGSVTNELQTLSQSGNTITLSNGGGSFNLPTFVDTDAQILSLNGNNLSISNGNTVVLPSFVEVDGSVTNELQTLSQSGNVVTLSQGGGSFTLPTFTDAQSLTLVGNTISISNGNSIVLPATNVVSGQNVTVTGTGSTVSPYVVNSTDTSLYANNGSIDQTTTTNNNRIVDMNSRNIWFNTSTSTSNGNIYIGSSTSYPNSTGNYKLFVEGGILTEKVKVALRSSANWADYVFENDYKLMPLSNVEQFIKENKHLPGVASANDLSKNGLDLAQMQAKQMEKIEELTLYLIEKDKKIEAQNKVIEKHNQEIETLKSQMKLLIEKTK